MGSIFCTHFWSPKTYRLCQFSANRKCGNSETGTVCVSGSLWPDEAELQELVERLLLDCDPAELTHLADMADPADPTAVAVTVRLAEDYKMAAFVADHKANICIAPSVPNLQPTAATSNLQCA